MTSRRHFEGRHQEPQLLDPQILRAAGAVRDPWCRWPRSALRARQCAVVSLFGPSYSKCAVVRCALWYLETNEPRGAANAEQASNFGIHVRRLNLVACSG
jgi:hypothetical protein